MVFAGWLFIETLTVVSTVLRISQRYAILSNVTKLPTEVVPVTMTTFIPEEPTMEETRDYMSIYDYGRKELCRTFHGQKHFYEVMKTKICNLTHTFVADHVLNLCGKRDENLDIWVAVLFDLDDDGYISYHEQFT